MTRCIDRLPKRNRKEYAGNARAEKESLNEQKVTMAKEFYDNYVASYRSLQLKWISEYVEVRYILLLFHYVSRRISLIILL